LEYVASMLIVPDGAPPAITNRIGVPAGTPALPGGHVIVTDDTGGVTNEVHPDPASEPVAVPDPVKTVPGGVVMVISKLPPGVTASCVK